MKLFLVVIFVSMCFIQFCSGTFFEEYQEYCRRNPNEVLTESEIEENTKLFESVKGISAQALDDFKKITKEHCILYHSLIRFVNGMKIGYQVQDKLLDADNMHLMLKMVGPAPWDMDLFNEEAAKISADKLDPEIKERILKLFNTFTRGQELQKIKEALTYLYGAQDE